MPEIPAPPVEPLRRLVDTLEGAGVVCALGGSALLASLGLADRVGDWDLTTDEPLERVRSALAGEPYVVSGPAGLHADDKLRLLDGDVEIIVRFAIHSGAATVRIPTLVVSRWNGLPMGSPEAWAVAYELLDRDEKAAALFAHLERHGARAEARELLLAQPLPEELRARVAALPTAPLPRG